MLPGSTEARRRLVQDALKYLDNLASEAGGDRDLLREVADAYERVAAVQAGAYQLASGATSAANLGDTAGAEASHAKAVAVREQLAASGDPADRLALAKAYAAFGAMYVFSGPPEKAVEHLQSAIAILESLLAPGPATQGVRLSLSTTYLAIAKAYGSPGGPNLGDTRSALSYTRSALKLQQELTIESPENIAYKQGLAATHNALSLIYSAMGEREEELEQKRKAVEVARTIVAAEPDNPFYRRELAVQLGNTGSAFVALKDSARALEYFREALALYDGLVASDPNDIAVRRQWAVAHRNIGVAAGAADPAEATQYFDKAIAILAQIAAKDPKNTDFRRQWAFTYLAKSRLQLEINELAAAVASAREGIRIGEELAASSPADAAVQNTLALLFTQLGASHRKAATNDPQSWREAKTAYSEALAIYERLKASGKLSGADAGKPEELGGEIATCDAAMNQHASAARSSD
jgi:tetratricopeptide (TPR) repeat protein